MSSFPEAPAGPLLLKAPTGIQGLDEVTGGGLPQGRSTLVTGGAGTGKTLLGVQFLVAGAREHGEPGVLVTFEESAEKVTANVASLGFDLDGLQRDGMLVIIAFPVQATEIVEIGEFDFAPLSLLLDDAINRIGARRVVLDSIEVLFGAFKAQAIVRAELGRLFGWLEGREVTAIVTGERADNALTRHGIEEYVSDCVIVLDHRVHDGVATRRLQVVKYRGSMHETNEYPFLISARGFEVLPVTAVSLDYGASSERLPTGVDRLDRMLSGGLYQGSTVLVTGAPGTGKTSLGAHLIDAACARGERALLVLFEESPDEVIRNMRSIGLDLRRWVEAGLLRMWAARPSAFGLETHLTILARLMDEHKPAVAVLDGITSLTHQPTQAEVVSMVARQIHLLKSRGITAMVTTLAHEDDASGLGVSSLMDSWLLLRNTESNGERNRLLFVLKSRGTAHSNQVREFLLTDHGIELADVYVGPGGVMTGSARLTQQARERSDKLEHEEQLMRRKRELKAHIAQEQAQLTILQEQLAAQQAELEQLTSREERLTAEAEATRAALTAQRRADPAGRDDRAQ
jgi:circadian clock protein KaiC